MSGLPVPPPRSDRPPAPPAARPTRLTAEQVIRAEALRAATAGGGRSVENAIQDAVIYARWIETGSRYE